MGRNDTFAQQLTRPLKHRLTAVGLSLLMAMNIAPEYGFGLSVYASEGADYGVSLRQLQSIVYQRSGGGAVDGLPGEEETSPQEAYDAFRGLLQPGETPARSGIPLDDRRTIFLTAGAEDKNLYGSVFCYNRGDSEETFSIEVENGLTIYGEGLVRNVSITTPEPEQPEEAAPPEVDAAEPSSSEGNSAEEAGPDETSSDEAGSEESSSGESSSESSSGEDVPESSPESSDASSEESSEASSEESSEESAVEEEPEEEPEEVPEDEPEESGDEAEPQEANEASPDDGGAEVRVEGAYVRVLSATTDEDTVAQDETGTEKTEQDDAGQEQAPKAEIRYEGGERVSIDTDGTTAHVTVGPRSLLQLRVLQSAETETMTPEEKMAQVEAENPPTLEITPAKPEYQSGQTISYTVKYYAPPAAAYAYSADDSASVFQTYNDVKITIPIPEGLTFKEGESMGETLTPSDDGHALEANIGQVSHTDLQSRSFTFPLNMARDGSIPNGTVYAISGATFSYSYDIRQKEGGTSTLSRSWNADEAKVTVTASEPWEIRQSVLEDIDTSGDHVTVKYRIEVGRNGVGDSGIYDAFGRLLLENYLVTETFSAYRGEEKLDLKPLSSSIALNTNAATAGGESPVSGSEGQETLEISKHAIGPKELHNISGAMHYSSVYDVEVHYPKEPFIVPFGSTMEGITLKANAVLNYKPLGEAEAAPNSEAQTKAILIKGDVATLQLEKYIREGSDNNHIDFPYDADVAKTYPGPVEFTLTPTEGGSSTIITLPTADGSYFVEEQLRPGKYTIEETSAPQGTDVNKAVMSLDGREPLIPLGEITLEATKPTTVAVVNKVTANGGIVFQKYGIDASGKKNPLAGATFKLVDKSGNSIQENVQSDKDGQVRFSGVKPGTYDIVETKAPDGYIIAATGLTGIKVEAGEITNAGEFPVNKSQNGTLEITKKIRIPGSGQEGTYPNNTSFTFNIYRKDAPSTVVKSGSTDKSSGNVTLKLPVYDVNTDGIQGAVIQYVLKEELSADSPYYMVDKDGTGIDQIEFTMVPEQNATAKKLTVYNSYKGSLSLKKVVVSYDKPDASETFEFQLFKKKADGTFEAVKDGAGEEITLTLTADEEKSVTGLDSDTGITYYWYETPNENYILKTDGLFTEKAPDDKVMINAGSAGLNMKALTVTNVAKAVELTIKKTDENGKALSNAEFDVYPVTGGQRGDKINQTPLVTGTDGTVKVILQPGTYEVEETKAPESYALYADKDGNHYQTVTIAPGGTDAKCTAEVTFINKQFPELKVTKSVGQSQMKWYLLKKANNGNQSVVFKLYTTASGGTPVQLNGQDAKIEIDMVADTATGSIRLPAGTYYLEEQPFIVDGFLGLIGDDGMPLPPTRQKIEVTNEGANVTIKNLTNFIDVEVSKIDELTGEPISGAEIEITSDWEGGTQGKLTSYGKKPTDADGKAGFILPIFTPDGKRILYTIKETKAADGYEGSALPEAITTYLKALNSTAKITVKINKDGTATSEKLEFENTPFVTVTAKKVWTDWTDDVNHSQLTKRPMAGATLGIYKEIDPKRYDYVESAVTDDFGIAQFGAGDAKLLPGTYVVAEIEPAEGFTLPADKKPGPPSGSITGLSEYIATSPLTIPLTTGAEDKPKSHAFYAGELVNTAGWAQFKVTKVKADSKAPYQGEDLLNYGTFDLYRQEAPTEGAVAYSEETRGEAVGHYVSGFSVGKEQVNEQGVFHTGILEPGYVYWLVETAAPDGYKVPEGNKGVIAFAPQKNLVDEKSVDQVIQYTAGKVTEAVVPNEPDTGSGSEGHGRSYVAVMFDKVLRTDKEDVPLGGAKFSLYIQTPQGLALLDDSLVTGKDSSSSNNIGRALSNPINLADLLKKNPTWGSEDDTKGIKIYNQDEGDKLYSKNPAYSATLVLRETWAPAGVIWEQKDYTLLVDTKNVTDAEAGTLQHVTINQDYTTGNQPGPIVNTPSDKNMVVLKKYGYVQTVGLAGKTDDELAAAGVTGTPLEDVTFTVYRKSDALKFEPYREPGATKDYALVTGADGTAQGALPDGVYRLVESLPKTLQDKYTNTHSNVKDSAYEFTVQGGQKNITLYNPEIPLLRIEKANDTAPDGLEIQLTGSNYNETFTAWAGNAIEVRLPAGTYTLKEIGKSKTTTGHYFGQQEVIVPADPATNTTTVQITNPTLGEITIKKFGSVNGVKDETLNLEGATFDLRYQPFKVTVGTDGKADSVGTAPTSGYTSLGTHTTGKDGTVKIAGLEPGWYKIVETVAPAGYVKATEPQYAVLYGGMVTTPDENTVEFLNEKHGGLEVTKTFDKGTFDIAKIPGSVTFNVYKDADGKQEATPATITVTIGNNGSGTSAPVTLPAGTYYLQEVAVDGWYRAEAKVRDNAVTENLIPVTIASGGSATVSVTNKPLMASITVKKVDSQEQSKALAGAVFELRTGKTPLATLTTGSDGTATAIFTLPEGTTADGIACQLVEITPPETYQVNDTPIDLTIKPGDVLTPQTNETLTVPNKAGVAIKLTKYVTGSTTPMSGVEFTLYRQNGSSWEKVDTKTTGSDGTILFDHLAEGIYAVAENEKALAGVYAGYALDSVSGATAIDPIGDMPAYQLGALTPGVNEIKAYNRAPETLTIYKRMLGEQDNSGPYGAKYEVYGPYGDDVEALPEGATPKLTTQQGHKVSVPLQPGKYFVKEIASDLPIDPGNPRTKTIQAVTVVGGQRPDDLIFYNAPRDDALKLDLVKSANPEKAAQSLLEGEQTVTFKLSGFNPTPGAVRLKSLTLTDQGLTAFSQENGGSPVTGVKYIVTNVSIGPASYKTYSAENTDGTQKAANVTLSIGGKTFAETLNGTKTFSPNAEFTAGQAEAFTLTYTSQDGDAMSDFTAGDVTITMTLSQEGGETVVPARRVVNTANASAITAGGKDVKSDNKTATVLIPEGSALPTMAIDKVELNYDGKTAYVGGTLKYQITLSNTSATAIQNPVIVDAVPASLLIKTDAVSGKRLYTVSGGELDGEPYLSGGYWVFKFKGALTNGAPITITYDAVIQPAAMENRQIAATAYGTSLATIPPRDGNPLGMCFRADNSSSSGGALTTVGVEKVNSAIATGARYGYVTKEVTRTIGQGTGVKITKEISTGGGFIGEGTNAQTPAGGTITYRLTIWNDSTNAITDVRLLDVLPHIGDVSLTGTRSSQWPVTYVDGSGKAVSGDVTVTPTGANTEQSIRDQLANRKATGGGDNAIFADFGNRTIESGKSLSFTYETTAPAAGDPKLNDYFYQLAVNNFSAMYSTVEGGKPVAETTPITSNIVTVGLTPSLVAVGGTVWIDEDMDGLLDENERSNADLAKALAGMTVTLTPHYKQGDSGQPVPGTINSDGNFLFTDLAAAAQDGNKPLYDGDNNLNPASLRGKAATYYTLQVTVPDGFALTTPYGSKSINKRSLAANDTNIAKNVSHFTLDGSNAASEKFFLWPSEKGTDTYKNVGLVRTGGLTVKKMDADDNNLMLPEAEFQIHGPFTPGKAVTAEMVTEDNLLATKATESNGTLSFGGLSAYQQYVLVETKAPLNYTFENATSDIGETLLVNDHPAWVIPAGKAAGGTVTVKNNSAKASLTIQKVVEGGAVPDDVFSITFTYDGKPYTGDYQVGGQTLTTEDGVIQLRADETATVSGLTVGKSYQISETAIPAGYALKAVANGDGSANWVIKPEGNMVTVTNTNTMNGKVILNAIKSLLNSDGSVRPLKADQFTFQVTGGNLTAKNDAVGNVTFPEIAFTGSDIGKTYTYTISEIAPEQNPSQGITYDTTTYTATVTVTAGENGALLTAVAYSSGDTLPAFTNTYKAAGEITLGAFKRVEGGATLRDGQFTFLLKEEGGEYSQEAANKADGTVTFAPISYEEPGEHDYTITEKGGFEYGYKYSDASYRVHVSVTDQDDGTLAAQATMDDKEFDSRDALFVNHFTALSLDLYKHRYGNVSRPINGAEFTLYRYDENAASNRGVAVGSGVTSGGGRLRFENLEEGRYVLVETYVPYRYSALKSQYEFNLSNDGNNNAVITLDSGELYASVRDHTLYVPNRYRSGGGGGDDDDSYRDDGSTEGGGGNPGTPYEPNPLTQIPDPAVPLAPGTTPLTTIPDEDVPLGGLPNTGGFPVGAFAVIGGLLALLGIKLKRNKRKEDA